MIVYRYLSEWEFKKILTNQIAQTGTVYDNVKLSNTFKYKKGVPYLHYFRRLKDFPKIQAIRRDANGKYLCKFNIPVRILLTRAGKGYYDATRSGYYPEIDSVKEFAVESSKMNSEYLVDFVYDRFCNMSVKQVKEIFESSEKDNIKNF